MTKVEELRERLAKDGEDGLFVLDSAEVNSLISAAHEEGAEQMKQKILAEAYPCRLSEKSHCWTYRIDDPVLAPTKEAEHDH